MDRTNTLSTPQARMNGLLKNVYLWMTAGLVLTALVAYTIGNNVRLLNQIYSTGTYLFLVLAQLAVVLILSTRLQKMSTSSAILCFILYSILTGATISSVVAIYAGAVVSKAFFTTALMFGAMSLYGMSSRRDLSRMGSIFVMALIGIIIASLLNFIFKSSALDFLISLIGVVLFCGITAWDTQKVVSLNNSYGYDMDEDSYIKLSIICALELYLDFINIFLYLVRIFAGSRRD
ncbi:MAG: Bax inhibitor-1/YccA family protein [Sphaerochaetaceae bacterium]|nr:Bax inhibitor-1/YccA family protein [Sphaerochaetaceae bacterium]